MARDNELRPLWLEPLLDNDFYEHDCICEVHNQYCTFFCKMCKNKPLCESCWRVDAEAEHELHQFLQIFKVSEKASVRKADIESEIDVRKIQPYVINNHKVILLKPKGGNGGNPKCVICEGKIKEEFYDYCSISCKIIGDTRQLDKVELAGKINRRKRTPCRSPLL
ncbi:uncharacterized protein LOC107013178 [Solanum pennellii]|uniref:Uncharacterized protein LOC107013178 n=1 Tax=Solanum pennellii TaxID=28526 RepID=A0ABM1GBF9_SOLPN|nr:uncharacterized protein LOC107013178 [Solanum pennellii]